MQPAVVVLAVQAAELVQPAVEFQQGPAVVESAGLQRGLLAAVLELPVAVSAADRNRPEVHRTVLAWPSMLAMRPSPDHRGRFQRQRSAAHGWRWMGHPNHRKLPKWTA